MPYKNPEAAAAAKKKYYLENKEACLARSRRRTKELRDEISALKEASPCVDCGVSYPYYVMHFDHLGLETKVDSVSYLSATAGRDAIFAEIDKCELVCANCHAIRTWKRRKGIEL